ncbi:hypothetical protein QCN29_25375 [Streptomyces sp. HNM0663]|uniref:Secreted protein n=1 Tax=Streptomyces chengmaiensis TaxID=3040919 RepID=A0ABT6HTK7_9ACTN|nr:hypothetical protein [Streptomyces chengmaiensis]MDH2392053.1 hypothetical protein [Streptomyces chengmaiensis]
MKLVHRIIATAAAAAACIATASTMVSATEASASGEAATSELPPYPVEDFSYPDADRIQAELGLVLKRGDGHITLADCSSASGLLEVYSRTKGKICFRVTGKSGHLSLEIPTVYGVRGGASHQTDVTLTAEGSEQNISVASSEWKAVGETADPQRRDHDLIGITTSQ